MIKSFGCATIRESEEVLYCLTFCGEYKKTQERFVAIAFVYSTQLTVVYILNPRFDFLTELFSSVIDYSVMSLSSSDAKLQGGSGNVGAEE